MNDDEKKGPSGAHTARDPENAPRGVASDAGALRAVTKDDLAASISAIGDELDAASGEQFDLLDADLNPVGDLEKIAEINAVKRRRPGRPKGATNRKNDDLFAYFETLGYRDPVHTLMAIQSADTLELAKAMKISGAKQVLGLLKVQVGAASRLMDFRLAKKPTELKMPEGGENGGMPVMIIGDNVQVNMANDTHMSAGKPLEKNVQKQTVDKDEL